MKPNVEAASSPPAFEVQPYGTTVNRPLGLLHVELVVEMLSQILADALTLRDLYKKHPWQASGSTFYQLHLLFDKHHQELEELADMVGERIHTLGGVSLAMGADTAESTWIPRPPRSRETAEALIARMLAAHEILIGGIRGGAKLAATYDDDGTNDLLIGGALRLNEKQVWFLSEHLQLLTK
jgi:starvation-inducible DNA-binding protein